MIQFLAITQPTPGFWDSFRDMLPSVEVVAFALLCLVAGLAVVLLDWIGFQIRHRSVLGFAYPSKAVGFRLLALWALGAGLGGLLGASFSIFVPSLQAAILVGASWPIVLPKLLRAGEEVDEPEQE